MDAHVYVCVQHPAYTVVYQCKMICYCCCIAHLPHVMVTRAAIYLSCGGCYC